jgi:hypothetical protein
LLNARPRLYPIARTKGRPARFGEVQFTLGRVDVGAPRPGERFFREHARDAGASNVEGAPPCSHGPDHATSARVWHRPKAWDVEKHVDNQTANL